MCSFLGWKVEKLECGAKKAAFPQQQQFRAALRCKADSKAEVTWDLCATQVQTEKNLQFFSHGFSILLYFPSCFALDIYSSV